MSGMATGVLLIVWDILSSSRRAAELLVVAKHEGWPTVRILLHESKRQAITTLRQFICQAEVKVRVTVKVTL
jgi:hypothetical protein